MKPCYYNLNPCGCLQYFFYVVVNDQFDMHILPDHQNVCMLNYSVVDIYIHKCLPEDSRRCSITSANDVG